MKLPLRSIKFRVRFVVEPDEDRFHAYCPELKGLHVDGATEQEALMHARDAATAYLRSLLKHDDPIPLGILESDESKGRAGFSRGSTSKSSPGKATSHIEDLSIAA